MAPSSSGLGRWPLKPETGIRLPLGPPRNNERAALTESGSFVVGLREHTIPTNYLDISQEPSLRKVVLLSRVFLKIVMVILLSNFM